MPARATSDSKALLELVEAAWTQQGVADDQQRPALPHHLEGAARAIEQFWPS